MMKTLTFLVMSAGLPSGSGNESVCANTELVSKALIAKQTNAVEIFLVDCTLALFILILFSKAYDAPFANKQYGD